MESFVKLRRRHLVKKESISHIARDLNLSRNTVKKYLKAEEEPAYQRSQQPCPKLGAHRQQLETWLEQDSQRPKAQRRTARRLYEDLQREGYAGAYDSVQRYVKDWKSQASTAACDAYVPLSFPPGETAQFDWSHEQVELGGVVQTIKLAHFRLTHSRQLFLAAYPRETQEMVFDAHNRAFAFFGGVPERMVYDNPKTIVQAILTGMERQFNRRFLALANHYLFEPVACTPASGWEKGQVENQVGNVREWLFTPRPSFADFSALNAWLEDRCRELAKRLHPEQTVKERLLKQPQGDRAFVDVLLALREHGSQILTTACERALAHHTVTAPVILNHVARLVAPPPPLPVVATTLVLKEAPAANCERYDTLRGSAPC
jgi:transposase